MADNFDVTLNALILEDTHDHPILWNNRFAWFVYEGKRYIVEREAERNVYASYTLVVTYNRTPDGREFFYLVRRRSHGEGSRTIFSSVLFAFVDKDTFVDRPVVSVYTDHPYTMEFSVRPYFDFALELGMII